MLKNVLFLKGESMFILRPVFSTFVDEIQDISVKLCFPPFVRERIEDFRYCRAIVPGRLEV
jgi:hypothetical protein